jgi:hypothetical protein
MPPASAPAAKRPSTAVRSQHAALVDPQTADRVRDRGRDAYGRDGPAGARTELGGIRRASASRDQLATVP